MGFRLPPPFERRPRAVTSPGLIIQSSYNNNVLVSYNYVTVLRAYQQLVHYIHVYINTIHNGIFLVIIVSY